MANGQNDFFATHTLDQLGNRHRLADIVGRNVFRIRSRLILDRANVPFTVIRYRETFEGVAHIVSTKPQRDFRVAVNCAFMLQLPDARVVEHDSFDWRESDILEPGFSFLGKDVCSKQSESGKDHDGSESAEHYVLPLSARWLRLSSAEMQLRI